MSEKLEKYFKGDSLAAGVWQGKYSQPGEETPDDMHRRLANEFARIELNYGSKETPLSKELKSKVSEYANKRSYLTEDRIYELFKDFKYIIPQGSIMSQLGASSIGSLSNCFVIGTPEDSYGGIFQKDEEMAQLMKRRGGVGIDISTLRPEGTHTSNAAKSSTGAISFMHRFSNTTREVAQNGRRGALMLSIDVNHPDVMEFIKIKRDLTQVTGANISIKLNDEFMKAVENDDNYILRFPCTESALSVSECRRKEKVNSNFQWKIVKAKEYWEEIIKSAHNVAEPGIIFEDNHHNHSPDGIYPQFKGVTTNPCFHPESIVETEFGRMKIKDMDKPMRVYSMDSDGKLVMSNASASFISKKNAQTLKIKLKSGSEIQVTPEHKMYVHDKGWVEAKDLQLGDRIAHLCRSRRGAKYAGVHLTTSPNKQRDQVMEHKLVFGPHEADYNIHHLDRDTYNNSINNLELLTHSEHSRITALEDNPQTHQIKDEKGRFISGENSRKGRKTIVDLPEELKTNMLSRFHNCIISIEDGETTDVYDIQVEDTYCLVVNNMVAHNCGEIFMQPYDACRLIAVNLFSFVENPFTDEAYFDFDKFYKYNYEAMRLSDDLIDLEIEHIDRILNKIENDPESFEVKERELELWTKVKKTATASRRTGLGFTALGDTLAALGLGYDSDKGLEFIKDFSKTKLKSELDCTTDLAIIRGPFEGWNNDLEFNHRQAKAEGNNSFYQMLVEEFPEQSARMIKFGRRNVSWSTIAPTGTVSLMTQTTSGIEPLFQPFYMRRKKVNPLDENVRVDFTDQNEDTWQEFPVLHEKFKEWSVSILPSKDVYFWGKDIMSLSKDDLGRAFKQSPWYGATANDIDWIKRVEIQAILQRYITHSISSTINLPEEVSEEEVSEIYLESWEQGLKGITVYRDGSRSGVLVDTSKEAKVKFEQNDAPKRPKTLKADVYFTSTKGEKFTVIVGLLEGKPYEVFVTESHLEVDKDNEVTKQKRGLYETKEGLAISSYEEPEVELLTRLLSVSLRHGSEIKFIVEQLSKTSGNMNSFSKVISRVLKNYIEDGSKSTISCNECSSNNVIFEEGCNKCLDCGNSKCG